MVGEAYHFLVAREWSIFSFNDPVWLDISVVPIDKLSWLYPMSQ